MRAKAHSPSYDATALAFGSLPLTVRSDKSNHCKCIRLIILISGNSRISEPRVNNQALDPPKQAEGNPPGPRLIAGAASP